MIKYCIFYGNYSFYGKDILYFYWKYIVFCEIFEYRIINVFFLILVFVKIRLLIYEYVLVCFLEIVIKKFFRNERVVM